MLLLLSCVFSSNALLQASCRDHGYGMAHKGTLCACQLCAASFRVLPPSRRVFVQVVKGDFPQVRTYHHFTVRNGLPFTAFFFFVNVPEPGEKRTRPSPHALPRYAHLRGRDIDLTTLRGACELWLKRCVACVRR